MAKRKAQTMDALGVRVRRRYDATREQVFHSCTDSRCIKPCLAEGKQAFIERLHRSAITFAIACMRSPVRRRQETYGAINREKIDRSE